MKSSWRRVRKDHPCPVCGHTDWCLIAPDGGAAICPRTESPRCCGEAGWLHRLDQGERRGPAPRHVRTVCLHDGTDLDLARRTIALQEAVDPGRLHALSQALGLSIDSLRQLGIGWSQPQRSWSFPMRNAVGEVCGIRLRGEDGRKFAIKGSKEGLFLPLASTGTQRLVIVEGPTDTAAILDMGIPDVVGRPSCTGGIRLLVELAQARRQREVIVLADNDEPDRRGAMNLVSVLRVYVPTVHLVRPPEGIKDAREWRRAGATRVDVERLIPTTPAETLIVRRKEDCNHGR